MTKVRVCRTAPATPGLSIINDFMDNGVCRAATGFAGSDNYDGCLGVSWCIPQHSRPQGCQQLWHTDISSTHMSPSDVSYWSGVCLGVSPSSPVPRDPSSCPTKMSPYKQQPPGPGESARGSPTPSPCSLIRWWLLLLSLPLIKSWTSCYLATLQETSHSLLSWDASISA